MNENDDAAKASEPQGGEPTQNQMLHNRCNSLTAGDETRRPLCDPQRRGGIALLLGPGLSQLDRRVPQRHHQAQVD